MNFSTTGLLSLERSQRANGARIASNIVRISHIQKGFAYRPFPVLEHGLDKHRNLALEHLISGLLEYATNEQGAKSVTKALKEGGKDTLNRVIKRMCEPAKG